MPAIENSETGSSRVTRSLRKRLTSVDTDSSSRPGTPVLTSLQTLQEAVLTPSKRATRRASMTTPVPTPSKLKSRVNSTEVLNSPARRSTRRRSLSTNEQEDTITHTKSKEPAFDSVKEEETVGKSPELKSKTTTFLSPISALVRHSDRPRSATPTPEKTKASEVLKSKSPEMSPKVLQRMRSPKVILKKEHIGGEATSHKKSPTMVDATPEKMKKTNETGSKQNSVTKKQPTPLKPLETSQKSDDAKLNTSQHQTPSKKAVEDSPRGSSMHTENETTLSATEVTQPCPIPKKVGRPRKLKNVGFNNTADEDVEKSVFPKTPGLTKSKSYILDSSKTDGNESVNKSERKLDDSRGSGSINKSERKLDDSHGSGSINKSERKLDDSHGSESINKSERKLDDSHEETEKDSVKDDAMEEDNDILDAKTPYKLKLSTLESSTPIQNTSIKKNKSIDQKNTSAAKDSEESKEDFAFPKSWSHSVSGTVNDIIKIDSIISEESLQKKMEEEKAITNKSANSSKSPRKKRSFADDTDEDLMDEDDLLVCEDDEEEEEKECEKSMFVDDEAMEVPEGEESMDSEERAYLEENEVPVYAESIGSEDTMEDEGEEEADEEDAAFVVSDTEEIMHEESDSDDPKKANKKYKRIMRNADSSDEESAPAKGKDDDFCLIVDSSVEEMPTKEKADSSNNSSKKEIKLETEFPEKESCLSILMRSVKSKSERMSLSKKMEDQQEKDDDDAEAVTDANASRKERKSLKNRKSVGAEQKSTTESQEDLGEAKPVTTPSKRRPIHKEEAGNELSTKNRRVSLYVEDLDSEAPTDADEVPRLSLSKKERKSLNTSKGEDGRRKSLMTPEKGGSVNSPSRRKSLKNQEDDVSRIEIQNEIKMSSFEESDASTEVEVSAPKLSKKERKSLNKSKADANKDVADSVRSPYKRKSLKNHEENHDTGFDDAESETKSPNELSLQDELNNASKAETSTSSRKGRKSVSNSVQTVEGLDDEDITDVEMVDAEESAEDGEKEVEKTPTKTARMSVNKRKSQIYLEDSEKESNLSANESVHKSETDPYEQGARDGDDEGDKPNYMNLSCRSDNPKSPKGKNNSIVKPSRKSIANTDAAEAVRSPYKRKSIKNHEENHDTGFDDAESETKSPNEPGSTEGGMSVNKSKSEKRQEKVPNTESDEEPNLSRNKSLHKTDSGPEEEPVDEEEVEAESDNKCVPKSPKGKNNSTLNQSRRSLSKSVAAEVIGYDGSNEDDCEENKPSDASQTSLNTSKSNNRKSLKRTSTEEFSDETEEQRKPDEQSVDLSKSDKSILFVEEDSDAEPVTAFEVSVRVPEEKSLNSPRINRKSMNQSISSPRISIKIASPRVATRVATPRGTPKIATPRKIASSLNVESASIRESDDDTEENVAEMSKVMEFLGEEESEKSSPPSLNSTRRKSLNKSKLDETFHLESNNSMLSRRDSLHRNILQKSLNQSKILGKLRGKGAEEDGDRDADVSGLFSDEEEVEIVRKVLPDKGLSVSLSGIECKKRKSKGVEEQFHKSFTIGVSLRNSGAAACFEKNDTPSSPDLIESCSNVSISEKDDLEKIENIEAVGPYKPRSSLSKIAYRSADENSIKAKSKRFSLYAPEGGASQSFVENLAEEKKKLHSKRSRKSNSFCGVAEPSEETATPAEESKPQKAQTPPETSKSETKTDIQRILSRCDEILEAANRAKREIKLNARKTKVKKPKWMDKEEKPKAEEEEVKIPLVSKKEIKRKEKMRKELAKAIKHSTAMLKTIDPKLVKKLKLAEVKPEPVVTEEEPPPMSSKRLPADFLDELEEVPKPKKKKTRDVEVTPPSDKENSKRSSNKAQPRAEGLLDGQKKKKKQSKEILQTASGTVIVEPVTPNKLKFQNGFRESPKTPVGFKVQDINDSTEREKAKKRAKKLFATTGAFEEHDVSHSNSKTNNKKAKKPRLHIEEPVYSLPKTQWTSSGMFVEEDIYTVHHPLANSTATQFQVSTLGGSKKSTKSSKVVSSEHMSTALNFKKNALFSEKVKREPARNLLQRNERKLINNRY